MASRDFLRLWHDGVGVVAFSGSATSRDAPLQAGISIESPEGPKYRATRGDLERISETSQGRPPEKRRELDSNSR